MTSDWAFLLTLSLVAFVGGLQSIELYLISKEKDFLKIWSVENLLYDVKRYPILRFLTEKIYAAHGVFQIILFAQFFGFLILPFFPNPFFIIILFFLRLFVCLRFRGTVNGGSDMLFFVVLTGLLISSLPTIFVLNSNFKNLGLIYIGIHGSYSYLKAGFVKIVSVDWRTGQAIPAFLLRSLVPMSHGLSRLLIQNRSLGLISSWSVILFEVSLPMIFWKEPLALIYFFLAMTFHFINYIVFGLNRFFWTWLMAWPSILYLAHIL